MTHWLKYSTVYLFLISVVTLVSTGVALATERVQLSAFLINVVENGRTTPGQMPITMFLDVKDEEAANYVCGIAPRIRDKIIRRLTKETFFLDPAGKLDTAKLRLDLWPVAYKAIPSVKLQNMMIVQGTVKVGSSEARLFARRGCRTVTN